MDGREIKRRLKAHNLNQDALAPILGRSKSSISRLLNDGRKLDVREAEKIESFLAELAAPIASSRRAQAKVPLYGFVSGAGRDRIAFSDERVLEWLERPAAANPNLALGALRVAGESMAPRLFPGEIVYFTPGVEPARGADCVVELADDTAMVKSYVGSGDGYVRLRQYNPDKEIRLRWDEIRALHAVAFRA